jgi:hypothetical protein
VVYFPLDDKAGAVAEDLSGHNYDGAYTGGTLASGLIRSTPVWTDNGTDGFVNLHTAGLNTNYPRAAGTMLFWAAYTGSWTADAEKFLFRLYINGNNQIRINKTNVSHQLGISFNHNAWNNSFSLPLTLEPNAAPFCLALSWDSVGGLAKFYFNGACYHKISGAQALVGNLINTLTLLGASAADTPSQWWTGPLGFFALFPSVLTEAQIAILSQAQLEDPAVYNDGFSIIHISDTFQTPSAASGTYYQCSEIAQWIVDNASKYNIQGVVYSGDNVETVGTTAAWDAVKAAFNILDAAEVPYHTTTGQHDYTDQVNRIKASFDTNFPQATYTGHAWWNGDFYEGGKSENAYWTFSYDGTTYLIMQLEV